MDQDAFIRKYRPDWSRLEEMTRRRLGSLTGPEVDEAVALYLRVSGHLAEAQSRYADAALIGYLSGVVRRAQNDIYGTRSTSARRLLSGLTVGYREAVRETAPYIAVSGILFVAVTALALLWVLESPEARAGLLPPQAQESIERFGGRRGDFGIGSGALSTFILLNNIRVALFAFALGITGGAGTVAVLVLNGLNIGVLAGAFTALGKGGPFWALILPHGLLELTAIFIAAGAGLRMGWALVAPGDRRRSASLAEAAGEAVVVVTGVIPAFILAGLIEGYVSGTDVPVPAQLAVGFAAWGAYVAFLAWPGRRRRRPSPPPQSVP